MKRQLTAALGVVGVLAVGTAAAAINVRMLFVASDETASTLTARIAAEVGATAPASTPEVLAVAPSPVTPVAAPQARMEAPGPRSREAVPTNNPLAAPPGERSRGARAPLSEATLALLRVAKMTHLSPEIVHEVAMGDDDVSPDEVRRVKEAAAQLGVTLAQLASAEEPPERAEGPGHGPGEHDEDRDYETDDD